MAVPITRPVPTDLGETVVLDESGAPLGRTQVLADIEAMAVRDLHDRYPGILTRQVIRLAIKAAAGREAEKQLGTGGAVLSSVFNAVTEQADLRAWYELPRSVHVARVTTLPGATAVKLRLLDTAGHPLREVSAPIVASGGKLKVVSIHYAAGRVLAVRPSAPRVARASAEE